MSTTSDSNPASRKGTKFAVFVSTSVIFGIVLMYVLITAINTYAFNQIITIHANTILKQNINTTNHEITCFLSLPNSAVSTLQHLFDTNEKITDKELLQQVLFSQINNIPQATGIMVGRPNGDFFFVKRHTDSPDTQDKLGENKMITKGYAVKVIEHKPNRQVSMFYYTGSDMRLVPSRNRINISNDSYDPRSRIWYQDAVKSSAITWSEPYRFFTSSKPGITVSAPLYSNGKLIGVVGIDIELDSLNDFANKIKSQNFNNNNKSKNAESTQAIIYISRKSAKDPLSGIVIANTSAPKSGVKNTGQNGKKLELPKVSDLRYLPMKRAAINYKDITKPNDSSLLTLANGKKYYTMFHPCMNEMSSFEMVVGFVIPYSTISGQISSFTRNLHFIFLGVAVLFLLGGFYISKRFSSPINQLSELAENISRLDFSSYPPIKYTPFLELNTAISAFDEMWKSLKKYKQRNTELSEQLKNSYRETIIRLASAAEYKDKDTHGHLTRISEYSALLAKQLGKSDEDIEKLRFASPMHDIGKIGIPDAILLKPGRYTPEEFDVMKMHSEYGHKLLQPPESEIMRLSASIALNHHEKYNGKGYPSGKAEEDIPLEARIVALVDVYDALRSKRCYKDAMTHEKVVAIIREERGEHFDPQVVDAFLELHEEFLQISTEFAS